MTSVILFHFLVLTQIIPYTIVWAGKISNDEEMRVFETISIAVNILLLLILLFKGGYIRNNIPQKILNGIIWFFVLVFALNTIGNLFAKTRFELYVFTMLTFVSAVLCWRIVADEEKPGVFNGKGTTR